VQKLLGRDGGRVAISAPQKISARQKMFSGNCYENSVPAAFVFRDAFGISTSHLKPFKKRLTELFNTEEKDLSSYGKSKSRKRAAKIHMVQQYELPLKNPKV